MKNPFKSEVKSVEKIENRSKGTVGEDMACDYLCALGYKLVTRNYKCKVGEIDLIFVDGKYIVFVEVKRRLTDKYGMPEEAVGYYKQNKIRRAAEYFMLAYSCGTLFPRFDVVGILGEKINYTKDAF